MVSLSIAIPMYNHEKTIRTTLNSIFSQLDEIKNICDLEVVIVDNCSTDKSAKIIKDEYLPKFSKILKYFKNEINIGSELNVIRSLQVSTNEYVWFLGDDKLTNGSISKLYNAIIHAQEKPSAIFCNWQACGDISEEKSPCYDISYVTNSDSYYANIDGFTLDEQENTHYSLYLLHAFFLVILRREEAIKVNVDFCNNYPHVDIALRLIKNKSFVITNRVFVIGTLNSAINRGDSNDILMLNSIGFYNIIYTIYGNIWKYLDTKLTKRYVYEHLKEQKKISHNVARKYMKIAFKIDFFHKLNLQYTWALKFINFFSPKLALKFLRYFAKNNLL